MPLHTVVDRCCSEHMPTESRPHMFMHQTTDFASNIALASTTVQRHILYTPLTAILNAILIQIRLPAQRFNATYHTPPSNTTANILS